MRLDQKVSELVNRHWSLENDEAPNRDRRVVRLCAEARLVLSKATRPRHVRDLRRILLERGMRQDLQLSWASLSDPDWDMRHEAWLNLTRWERMKNPRGLRWALGDEEAIIRRDAGMAAGEERWPGSLPILRAAFLNETDPWARGGLAIGLAHWGDQDGMEQVFRDSVSGDPNVRCLARRALASTELPLPVSAGENLSPIPWFEAIMTRDEGQACLVAFRQAFPEVEVAANEEPGKLATYRFARSGGRPFDAIWLGGSAPGPVQLNQLRGQWRGFRAHRMWWRDRFAGLPVRWFEGGGAWRGFPIHVSEAAWEESQRLGFADQTNIYRPSLARASLGQFAE
jgi:hypothetical protein